MEGGYSEQDFIPYETDDPTVTTRGCHTGPYSALNIQNPQPNMAYVWVSSGRNGARMLGFEMQGYEPVLTSDPEMAGSKLSSRFSTSATPTATDTLVRFADVVLMRTSQENLARIHEERRRTANAQLNAHVEEFLHPSDEEAELAASHGRQVRMKDVRHRGSYISGRDE